MHLSLQEVGVGPVTYEHHRDGDAIGIGEVRPRLSWRFSGTEKMWKQYSYELEIWFHGTTFEMKEPGVPFKGEFKSSDSVLVPWPCRPLLPRESATVKVRAFKDDMGRKGPVTTWSIPSTVEVGLLLRIDWESHMIAAPRTLSTSDSLRPALFRKEFHVKKAVYSARLYITAYGIYEAFVNGERVGDHVLAPGWTSYKYRLNYQTFDITKLLKKGNNALAAEVGEGWYCGRLGYLGGRRCNYGDELALLAQLEVVFDDGEHMIIGSDRSWKTLIGPTVSAELYDGEAYDARLELPGWSSASFEDGSWSKVTQLRHPHEILQSPEGPPVRHVETIKPIKIFQTPSGKTVVDFGQNLVGRLKVKISGPLGHQVIFTHVEVLENGEIATRPLRFCKATDSLILAGKLTEWEPKFTFHGFRYVQIDHWRDHQGEIVLEDIEARVIHTDMERIGWFDCSDTGDLGVNQLHKNIVWGMKGNFVSIPTDCPQRDERLGWTGDIQVFSPTANFLYDTSGMLSAWLKDLALEQKYDLNGVVGEVVPLLPGITSSAGKAAWSDAGIMVPWELYSAFSDRQILKDQLESMKAWLDKGLARRPGHSPESPTLWDSNSFQFGDWLDPDAPPDNAGAGKTDPQFVANAYLVHVTNLMWRICEVLGNDDAPKYQSQAAKVKNLFQDEYMTPNGRLVPETMTSLALAIEFDLLSSPAHLKTAGQRLDAIVRASKFKIGTGFIGTPLILPALTRVSKNQLAYRMLHEDKCPSWLYPLTMGATTMWERWDSMLPDGSLNTGAMTSFNHYALGSVGAWLHSTVGGVSAEQSGWKDVRIEPRPGGKITWAEIKHLSPYGMIECRWDIKGDTFILKVSLPPNCTGKVKLPGDQVEQMIGSGKYNYTVPYQTEDYPTKEFNWVYQKLGPGEH